VCLLSMNNVKLPLSLVENFSYTF